jgi:hypothetical protein
MRKADLLRQELAACGEIQSTDFRSTVADHEASRPDRTVEADR